MHQIICRNSGEVFTVLRLVESVCNAVKPVALLAFACPFFVATAEAAEVAERHIHGFNSTGTVFVFEQFGIQDGSGFPYSQIFHVLTANSGAAFLPVRALGSESQTVGSVRRKARKLAFKVDGFLGMGQHVFHRALNEAPSSVTTVRFYADYATTLGHLEPLYRVSVGQQASPQPECDFGGDEKTFEVTLENLTSGTTSTLWAAAFPWAFYNYFCPTDYAIADVILDRKDFGASTRIAVLISVLVRGFEGPDRRFVAATGELN